MITVPRVMVSTRPTATPPIQPMPQLPPPPAHIHTHQSAQRLFEDHSGRYRRYPQNLHRWHTPVMADPPNLNFHHGMDDLQHHSHYHNPTIVQIKFVTRTQPQP